MAQLIKRIGGVTVNWARDEKNFPGIRSRESDVTVREAAAHESKPSGTEGTLTVIESALPVLLYGRIVLMKAFFFALV